MIGFFFVNKGVKFLNLYDALLHGSYYLYHLPIQLFKIAWYDQQFLYLYIIFIIFFPKPVGHCDH